jgi:hypothetical protein
MNLDPRDAGHADAEPPARKTPEQAAAETDREVPLANAATPDAIHSWLDGEPVRESQLQASDKEYKFWRKVEEEAGRRRRVMTPSSLPSQIMKAIEKKED